MGLGCWHCPNHATLKALSSGGCEGKKLQAAQKQLCGASSLFSSFLSLKKELLHFLKHLASRTQAGGRPGRAGAGGGQEEENLASWQQCSRQPPLPHRASLYAGPLPREENLISWPCLPMGRKLPQLTLTLPGKGRGRGGLCLPMLPYLFCLYLPIPPFQNIMCMELSGREQGM